MIATIFVFGCMAFVIVAVGVLIIAEAWVSIAKINKAKSEIDLKRIREAELKGIIRIMDVIQKDGLLREMTRKQFDEICNTVQEEINSQRFKG